MMNANEMIQEAIRHGGSSQILFVSAADLREAIRNMANDIAEQFMPQKEEKFLTTKETSRLLNVDISTLYRWEKNSYLKPIRIGIKKLYRLSDIDKIKDNHRGKS